MKLGIMQPYFFPYLGYYQLINFVDTFILYDDVNYIKRGWINRNYILLNGKKHLITLPLKQASQNKLINQIHLDDHNNKKILNTIFQAYSKAPYFDLIFSLIVHLFALETKNLASFLSETIKIIAEYLNISTDIKLSSHLTKDNALKGEEKILHICEVLGADHYVNAIGGIALYSRENFLNRNIKFSFVKTKTIRYAQFKNAFIPNLSMIDLLMFNPIEKIRHYLDELELI
jgi:hypothetical protein